MYLHRDNTLNVAITGGGGGGYWSLGRGRYSPARVLLYAPSHGQGSTYHGLYYTSRGALAGTRNTGIR